MAMPLPPDILVAADIGNSRIKLGRFDRAARSTLLPEPAATCELPLANQAGDFDLELLATWCGKQVAADAQWLISSVHRGATEQLIAGAAALGERSNRKWTLRQIACKDVPLVIEVDAPERVGMDRLLAAVATDRLRPADQAAIVVDLGTAIKVDLLSDVGAFLGGAILPGLAMSARALNEQTDALPRVAVDQWHQPPRPLGKATVPAIESGLFWGAVGAVRELILRLSATLTPTPEVFISGGGSKLVSEILAQDERLNVHHLPHLVLSGIALVDEVCLSRAGG